MPARRHVKFQISANAYSPKIPSGPQFRSLNTGNPPSASPPAALEQLARRSAARRDRRERTS